MRRSTPAFIARLDFSEIAEPTAEELAVLRHEIDPMLFFRH
jgi:hypothetical protein